jgi:uncharacterized protein involved in exopolysaccharide biosynthesis
MTEETKSSTKYVMVESSPSVDEDEIDLIDLIRTLLKSWKVIFAFIILSVGAAFYYSKTATEIYRADVLLASAEHDSVSGVSSAISNLGGLAALAGISVQGDSNIEKVIATLKSRDFLVKFITRKNLLPVIFHDFWDSSSNRWRDVPNQEKFTASDGVTILQGAINCEIEKSGLITLSVSWGDPDTCAEWANALVRELNEQLREKAIADSQRRIGYLEKELAKTSLQDMRLILYNLLESEKQKSMLANVNEDFALEVIDPAVSPQIPEKPKRQLIIALGGVCGIFVGIFAVFFLQFMRKLKSSSASTKIE